MSSLAVISAEMNFSINRRFTACVMTRLSALVHSVAGERSCDAQKSISSIAGADEHRAWKNYRFRSGATKNYSGQLSKDVRFRSRSVVCENERKIIMNAIVAQWLTITRAM